MLSAVFTHELEYPQPTVIVTGCDLLACLVGVQNRPHERGGNFLGEGIIRMSEGSFGEADRLLIASQILDALVAPCEVLFESPSLFEIQIPGAILGEELGHLSTSHCPALSALQKLA
jgi:hypothetical protein